MSVYPLATTHPTLLDVANETGADGNIIQLAEILNQTNRILDEMVFIEGNLPTGHMFAVRTGLPTPVWRRLYQGVQPTKANGISVTASCGTLEDYAEIDKRLADLNSNAMAYRMQQDAAHIEGFNQKVASDLFIADETVTPEAFTGLNAHYNDLSAGTGENIIDAGGTGSDNGSIWLVAWGPGKVYGIYPRGSQAGLVMEDQGEVRAIAKTADGSADGYYQAYSTHYKWDVGLVVEDWRYAVRIANIDRSNLSRDLTSGTAILAELMFDAMEHIPTLEGSRLSFYMDRTMIGWLGKQAPEHVKTSTLDMGDRGGRRVTSFQEVPIGRVDSLNVDEARVT